MKKALILHGWEASPEGHWMPWLKKELEAKGYEVHIPALSDPEYPILGDQMADVADISLAQEILLLGIHLGDSWLCR